ncbi:glycerophosphodiester phosphodiesterase [Candidatus Nomurabacteria bacterium]|nr:glycerophosphodiester phosphodiesterase [Candidatus Nomurabacteria bacterium]
MHMTEIYSTFFLRIGTLGTAAIILVCLALLLSLIYVLAIFPGSKGIKKKESLKSLKGWDYAHRGLHDASAEIYENTVPAFERAVKNGYGAELDVQLTADKIPVVFHDFDLKRMCGVDKKVSELKYDEIIRYPIMSGDSVIPKFEEVLRIFEGRAPLIVEIKLSGNNTESCEYIDKVLSEHKVDHCIESFNPWVVRWYKANKPGTVRGQLSSDFFRDKAKGQFWLKFIMKNLMTNFLTQPDFVAYDHASAGVLAFRIYRKLYKGFTVAWTIRTADEHEKACRDFDVQIFESFTPERNR